MNKKLFSCLLLFAAFTANNLQAQDVMFQNWYWNYPSIVSGKKWLAAFQPKLEEMSYNGIGYLWLPPLARGGSSSSMGYDVTDYFDYGQYQSTRWGTRSQLNNFVAAANNYNIKCVGDLVYNHREGGKQETNVPVKGWINNFNATKYNNGNGDSPYPSDRVRCYVPIGPGTLHGAGVYYVKVKSASNSPNFTDKNYHFFSWTKRTPADYSGGTQEVEPNGGGACGQGSQTVGLGKRIFAKIDNPSACNYDEFKITIDSTQFNRTGDTLYFSMANVKPTGGTFGGADLGDMSDHRIDGIWHVRNGDAAGHEITPNDLTFQTDTNFNGLPSGRGGMNYSNFRPNGDPCTLNGDQESMLFFYDIDQNKTASRDTLREYTKYAFQNAGMQGMRVDAVKHFPSAFFGNLLDYLHTNGIDPPMVVGESYDYNAGTLKAWVDAVYANMNQATKNAIVVRIFDFALREQMRQACDAFGYDVRNLYTQGCVDNAQLSGLNVVSFVTNHDFREPSQFIQNDPILPYAYILTNQKLGTPCVYYPDYYGANNMRGDLNALLQVRKKYLRGAPNVDYLNKFGQSYPQTFTGGYPNTTLAYQVRGGVGGRDAVVVINFAAERLKLDQQINDATMRAGDTLTDIITRSGIPYTIVNGQRMAHFEVPPRSFGIWIKGDLRNKVISSTDSIYTATEDVKFTESVVNDRLQVFPNPFQQSLNIAFDAPENGTATVQLINALGQEVAAQRLAVTAGEQSYTINIDNTLSNGVYFMLLRLGDKMYRTKVVRE